MHACNLLDMALREGRTEVGEVISWAFLGSCFRRGGSKWDDVRLIFPGFKYKHLGS